MEDIIISELKKNHSFIKYGKYYNGYVKLLKLYKSYPECIIDLIKNLYKFRSYRDYFDILLVSKDKNIDDIVYNILKNQYKKDSLDYKSGKNISNLAKWLPRKNKMVDKKINFVTNFSMKLYPHLLRESAEKKYRKKVSKLCQYLQVPERFITQNNLNDINFDKISHFCLKRNYKKLTEDLVIKNKISNMLSNKYTNMDFNTYIRNVLMDSKTDVEKESLNTVWEIQKTLFLKKYKLFNINNILVDLNDKLSMPINIGIALIILDNNKTVIINSHTPYLYVENLENKTIYNRVEALKKHVNFCKKIMNDKAKLLLNDFTIISIKNSNDDFYNDIEKHTLEYDIKNILK